LSEDNMDRSKVKEVAGERVKRMGAEIEESLETKRKAGSRELRSRVIVRLYERVLYGTEKNEYPIAGIADLATCSNGSQTIGGRLEEQVED
jgi:hypothetical protein